MAEKAPSPEDASKNPDATPSGGSFGSWWGRRSGWISGSEDAARVENVSSATTASEHRGTDQGAFWRWYLPLVARDIERGRTKEGERRRHAREELEKMKTEKVVDAKRFKESRKELRRALGVEAPDIIPKLIGWTLLGLYPVWLGGRDLAKWLAGKELKWYRMCRDAIKKPYEKWMKERWKLKKKSSQDFARDVAVLGGLEIREEGESAAEAEAEPQQPPQAA